MMHTIREPETRITEEKVERIETTLDDIFNEKFMSRHTDMRSIGEFFLSGGFLPEDMRGISELPRNELDAYVRQHTDFQTWDLMLHTAVNALLADRDLL